MKVRVFINILIVVSSFWTKADTDQTQHNSASDYGYHWLLVRTNMICFNFNDNGKNNNKSRLRMAMYHLACLGERILVSPVDICMYLFTGICCLSHSQMSRVTRNLLFAYAKTTDQLRSNCAANQRL